MFLLTTDERYLWTGDGVHLYITSRLAEGAVPYRDMLTPHPPLLFTVGAFLLKINNSLWTIRIFSIILGIATSFLIYLISSKIFADKRVALVTSTLYYIMPIHLTWSRGFETDSLMIFFSLLAFRFILSMSPRKMILASFFSVLAILTKYSFLPSLIFTVGYLYFKRKELLKHYLIPLIIMLAASFLFLNVYSSNMFFWSTFTVQGMSPFTDIYTVEKRVIGFFSMEGPLLLASILGMIFFVKIKNTFTDYLIGSTLVSFLPLALMIREGTGLYIIYGAEPFMAIFAGYFLYVLMKSHAPLVKSRIRRRSLPILWRKILIGLFMLTLLFNPVLDLCTGQFLNFRRYDNWSNAPQVRQIMEYVGEHTSDEDFILSPPYFAFITQRKLLFDFSDTWLWKIAYDHGDPKAVELVQRLSSSLENKAVKLVILDYRMKSIEPVFQAISENYRLIYRATIIENFGSIHNVYMFDTIEVYIPQSSIDRSSLDEIDERSQIKQISQLYQTPQKISKIKAQFALDRMLSLRV
jgi:hypothetical protein